VDEAAFVATIRRNPVVVEVISFWPRYRVP